MFTIVRPFVRSKSETWTRRSPQAMRMQGYTFTQLPSSSCLLRMYASIASFDEWFLHAIITYMCVGRRCICIGSLTVRIIESVD